MKIEMQLSVLAVILTISSVSAVPGPCKVCESTSLDSDCQKNPSAVQTDCNAEKCFTLVQNSGLIKRGCVATDKDKCDGKNCKPCDAKAGSACNVQTDLFWCRSCDSSAVPDCALWKDENSIEPSICESGVTKCFMEIKSDKHTLRRCATKNDETCPSDGKCETCSDSNGCNKGVFPSDRRQCYQCSSDNSKCATPKQNVADISSFPCLLYDASDKCFEHGSSDSGMSRGCSSDTTAYGKCTSESPKEKCKECTTNGCNVDEYKMDPTNKCIQCKSDDVKCAEIHTSDEAKKCETKIEYWKPQGCYTNKIEAGKVNRGCIQDFDCASASSTCTSCTSETVCNTGDAKINRSCLKCRSDENDKCAKALENDSYKSEKCRNDITSDAEDLCYVEKWNDIVIRSCLVDADPKTRNDCLDTNYKFCKTCKGENCNNFAAPDTAHSIALTSGLMALTLLVLKFF